MFLLKPPGVYRPQGDSFLLREALLAAPPPAGGRVLDLGTGTGMLALAAAGTGASRVWAVDSSYRAVLTARCNALLRGLRVRVTRGDLRRRLPAGPFDLVTANPPYVPCADAGEACGRARAWDAGLDGRRYLDPLCRRAPALLAPGGSLLLVHSVLCSLPTTVRLLREGGLGASVVARRRQPFGPVLGSRASWLEERGLIAPGQTQEELVVIRARRVAG
ncbi:methyltransferase domain-containing protein [Streptomyces sp. RKND-216]|uniref:HemK2/MTQ2 family protein methyltransferase n=1 Tax=Streptomyces sp. RKND-216 TaxID=2562581 RepID=UPI00109DA63B|nr:HemK2/MTQ2 family protein methyltransferase [Streptomyces sp. RKND-216]THA23609.1 methyltransferase domain-containing protein [Streptomyces sp. RKND-216]